MQPQTPEVTRWGPSHPLCLLATAVLLLNDHLLKALWPGLVTGKLSDVMWLLVAPVVVAAVLAWLRVPAGLARGLALGAVGAAFVTLQLWPPLGDTWVLMFGGSHTPDLTDLWTLPALAAAPLCWRQTRQRLYALPVAAFACLATSWVPCNQYRLPEDGEDNWDPNEPLMLSWADSGPVRHDSSGILSGITLAPVGGEPVELVATSRYAVVYLCPVGGLLPDTDYVWEVNIQPSDSTNQLHVPPFNPGGTRTFRTGSASVFEPAMNEADCAKLAADSTKPTCAPFDSGVIFDTAVDTGFGQ